MLKSTSFSQGYVVAIHCRAQVMVTRLHLSFSLMAGLDYGHLLHLTPGPLT